jgi:hypothetical protein
VDDRTTMPSESVCQVARSWVDVGSLHTRLFIIFVIFTASVRNILVTPSYMLQSNALRFVSDSEMCLCMYVHCPASNRIVIVGNPFAAAQSVYRTVSVRQKLLTGIFCTVVLKLKLEFAQGHWNSVILKNLTVFMVQNEE